MIDWMQAGLTVFALVALWVLSGLSVRYEKWVNEFMSKRFGDGADRPNSNPLPPKGRRPKPPLGPPPARGDDT